jgi:GNAT superfamily N-acetyltransferase
VVIAREWRGVLTASNRHWLPTFQRIKRRLWHRSDELLFAFNIAEEPRQARPRSVHTFRVVSLDSLHRGGEVPVLDVAHRDEVMRRLQRGDLCCVVEVDGLVVGYVWAGYRRWNLDDLAIDVSLRDDECFFYDAYIAPQYRGQGIYYALVRHLWEVNRVRGLRIMYARVRRRNIASLAGIRFLGPIERLELKSTHMLSALRFHRATLSTGTGRTIARLMAESTRIGLGLFTWSATGRSGFRLRLPLLGDLGRRPMACASDSDAASDESRGSYA